jgi:pyrimidine deaminase RibD-like protein
LLSDYESKAGLGLGLTDGASIAPSQPFAGSDDRRFACLAIEEARRSVSEPDGRPHPKVGAVVVKNGQVLSSAHRGEESGNHAEFIALERKLAESIVAGATVYTTLEPCTTRNHPKIPCARRLIERKVARVVVGMLDPDPRIRGLGLQALRDANIAIALFPPDLMTEVEELNREFKRHHISPPSATQTPELQSASLAPSAPDYELEGELYGIYTYPRIGVPFDMFMEHRKLSGVTGDPAVDYDVLISLYLVNKSAETKWVRDISGSVEIGGVHKWMERQEDFIAPVFNQTVEYGWEENPNSSDEPKPLPKLFPELPYELSPGKPTQGWVRLLLKNINPDKIDANTWMFIIVDSLGKEHPITKTVKLNKRGTIALRRFS